MDIPMMYHYDIFTKRYTGARPAQVVNGVPITQNASATAIPVDPLLLQEIPEDKCVVWSEEINDWKLEEDHCQKVDQQGMLYGGTPYWLPGDTWDTPARYMTLPGKLPADAIFNVPEKPAPTTEELILIRRGERKIQMDKTDRFLMLDSDLNDDQKLEVMQYRRELKDMPLQTGYPTTVTWPVIPDCIKDTIDK